MEVFKICREKYSSDLNSSGVENRWNRKGQFVIYTAASRSLSTLELVAHRAGIMPSALYKLLVISINDDESLVKQLQIADLPLHWNKLDAYPQLQEIGANWYDSRETLILKVPSAIIPKEFNYVINTKHPSFLANVKLVRNEDYFWDERLL